MRSDHTRRGKCTRTVVCPQGDLALSVQSKQDLALKYTTIARVQDTVAIALNSCRSGANFKPARSWVATAGYEGREPQTKLAKVYNASYVQPCSMPLSTCTGSWMCTFASMHQYVVQPCPSEHQLHCLDARPENEHVQPSVSQHKHGQCEFMHCAR